MAYYGTNQEMQVSTGKTRTTVDPYNSSLLPTGPGTGVYVSNGAQNTLGQPFYDYDATNGFWTKYRYVKYGSTANAALVAFPAPVFWVDEYRTTVSSTMSEGFTATQQDIAGWMMPNTGDMSALTAAILDPTPTTGGYVFIAVGGTVLGAASAASIAAGDWLIGGATAWVPVRVASGTTTGLRQAAIALTAVSSSKSDIFIILES